MKNFILRLLPVILVLQACHKDPAEDFGIGIVLNQTALSLRAGESATLTATVTPEDLVNKTVLWTTSNTDVAKVRGGVVTAVAPGSATITAKTDRGGVTATCKVTVLNPILVSSIRFADATPIVDVHESAFSLNVAVLPEDATDASLDWSSSNESIATVKDGVLTAVSKGTVTVTATARDAGKVSASCEVTVLNIPDAVDLGLSVKWASFNLGAKSPEGYGDYFSWGEITTKENYYFSNYRFASSFSGPYSKYNTLSEYGPVDNKTVLESVDDAAYAIFKGHWRMPTEAEFAELIDGCTWTWTTAGGVSGYRFTGKKSGYTDASIFLPAAGFRQGKEFPYSGEYGFYWTSSLQGEDPTSARLGYFDHTAAECGSTNRFVGLPIRPVTNE